MARQVLLGDDLCVAKMGKEAFAISHLHHALRRVREMHKKLPRKGQVVGRFTGAIRLSSRAPPLRFPGKLGRLLGEMAWTLQGGGLEADRGSRAAFSFRWRAPVVRVSASGSHPSIDATTCG